MECLRIKLRDAEDQTIEIDLWGERNGEGRFVVTKHLSLHAEWLDHAGDIYPFSLRYDGVLDYGAWSEDGQKGSHLFIHGIELREGVTFEYKSKAYDSTFVPISYLTKAGWTKFR